MPETAMEKDEKRHRSIHWFRKGLRLHDNPALLAALDNASEMWPVFVLDPWFVANARVGTLRWRFLSQTLIALDNNLKKLGGRLYVVRGKPAEVFPKLFNDWKISKLTFEVDIEPYAKSRDVEIEALAQLHDVETVKHVSHTLYDTQRVIAENGGSPPLTYQKCQSVLSQLGSPPVPVPSPTRSFITNKGVSLPVSSDHDSLYAPPNLAELGVEEDSCGPCLYPGGEAEGLQRMEEHLKKTAWICAFEKPKTAPNSLKPSTTVLSPYLKFGCLSARTFYWKLQEIYKKNKKHSSPPMSLEGQLLWREFFTIVGDGTPNFDQMEGNKVCRQIPWELNQEWLQAWKEGRTGYPFIDALMIQLKTEGWIHHLGRHAVACFLTRGDLWCPWEEGMKVFEEYLLDADWSLNAANWMWLSASAFFHQYFRVYSPIAFGKKTDKRGEFIKKYLPILKKFPEQYVFEPWKAPVSLQKAAGCIIGLDYPKPIVDHDIVRERNIKRMAAAYQSGKEAGEGSSGDPTKGKDSVSKRLKSSAKSSQKGSMEKFLEPKEKKSKP